MWREQERGSDGHENEWKSATAWGGEVGGRCPRTNGGFTMLPGLVPETDVLYIMSWSLELCNTHFKE